MAMPCSTCRAEVGGAEVTLGRLERPRGGRLALALGSVFRAVLLGRASAGAGGGRSLAALAGAHRAARGGQAAVGPEPCPSQRRVAGSHFSAARIPQPPPRQAPAGRASARGPRWGCRGALALPARARPHAGWPVFCFFFFPLVVCC